MGWESPTVNGSPWSARAVVHPHPLYGIDGEPTRTGNGLYDKMRPVGAHEVIVENARHDRHLWNADDREIEEYLALCAQRIQDLKGDRKSTRLNSSHLGISYAVFCLKKKIIQIGR